MKGCVLIMLAALAVHAGALRADPIPVPTNALSLDEALALTLAHNAGLRALGHAVSAADGRARQAGAWPNPALAAEVENVGGEGDADGLDAAETTISLAQRLEVGGQRGLRRARARADQGLAVHDRAAAWRDVTRDTRIAFAEALAAQERALLRDEALQLARQMATAAEQRVRAGKDAPVEAAQARAEHARAQVEVDRAQRALAGRHRALSVLWGDSTPDFAAVEGDLVASRAELPDVTSLTTALNRSPEWLWWDAALEAAHLDLRAERAGRIPDLSVGVGMRHARDEDATSYVAGLELDLPLLDRRRGAIAAAQADLERVRVEQAAAHLAMQTEMAAAYDDLVVARKNVQTLESLALPAATEAFTAAEAAYRAGKIGYTEAQDARRGLIEVREERIEALLGCRQAEAVLDRLLDHDGERDVDFGKDE